jgi:hypothetical protein
MRNRRAPRKAASVDAGAARLADICARAKQSRQIDIVPIVCIAERAVATRGRIETCNSKSSARTFFAKTTVPTAKVMAPT